MQQNDNIINNMVNNTLYSDENIKQSNRTSWVPSLDYQHEQLIKAIKHFSNPTNKNTAYKSTLPSYDFMILPCYNESKIYILLRPDGTFGYLQKIPRFIQLTATEDIQAKYLSTFVKISKGEHYWIRDTKPDEPIIGWHGSKNPPCDMDGCSLVN
jgi:hypothetical protein